MVHNSALCVAGIRLFTFYITIYFTNPASWLPPLKYTFALSSCAVVFPIETTQRCFQLSEYNGS